MVEIKIVDKDNGKMAMHSGDGCMSIIWTKGESNVSLFGSTNLLDFAEKAGASLSSLFKEMSKRESEPYASELIARHFFMKKFYGEAEKEPKGKEQQIPMGTTIIALLNNSVKGAK